MSSGRDQPPGSDQSSLLGQDGTSNTNHASWQPWKPRLFNSGRPSESHSTSIFNTPQADPQSGTDHRQGTPQDAFDGDDLFPQTIPKSDWGKGLSKSTTSHNVDDEEYESERQAKDPHRGNVSMFAFVHSAGNEDPNQRTAEGSERSHHVDEVQDGRSSSIGTPMRAHSEYRGQSPSNPNSNSVSLSQLSSAGTSAQVSASAQQSSSAQTPSNNAGLAPQVRQVSAPVIRVWAPPGEAYVEPKNKRIRRPKQAALPNPALLHPGYKPASGNHTEGGKARSSSPSRSSSPPRSSSPSRRSVPPQGSSGSPKSDSQSSAQTHPRPPAKTRLSFPDLKNSSLSQHENDQAALVRLRDLWNQYAHSWPLDIQQTILSCLPEIKWTKTNDKQPSGHKLWKEAAKWNFAHWVIFKCVYPNNSLQKMRADLNDAFKIDLIDDLSYSTPWEPREKTSNTESTRTPQTSVGGKSQKRPLDVNQTDEVPGKRPKKDTKIQPQSSDHLQPSLEDPLLLAVKDGSQLLSEKMDTVLGIVSEDDQSVLQRLAGLSKENLEQKGQIEALKALVDTQGALLRQAADASANATTTNEQAKTLDEILKIVKSPPPSDLDNFTTMKNDVHRQGNVVNNILEIVKNPPAIGFPNLRILESEVQRQAKVVDQVLEFIQKPLEVESPDLSTMKDDVQQQREVTTKVLGIVEKFPLRELPDLTALKNDIQQQTTSIQNISRMLTEHPPSNKEDFTPVINSVNALSDEMKKLTLQPAIASLKDEVKSLTDSFGKLSIQLEQNSSANLANLGTATTDNLQPESPNTISITTSDDIREKIKNLQDSVSMIQASMGVMQANLHRHEINLQVHHLLTKSSNTQTLQHFDNHQGRVTTIEANTRELSRDLAAFRNIMENRAVITAGQGREMLGKLTELLAKMTRIESRVQTLESNENEGLIRL